MPPTGGSDLIGKDPEVVEEFDLEASIEGRFVEHELSRLDLAPRSYEPAT